MAFEPHGCAVAAQLSLLQPTVVRDTVFKFSLNVQFVSPSLLVFTVWSPSFLSWEAQGGSHATLALEVLGWTWLSRWAGLGGSARSFNLLYQSG